MTLIMPEKIAAAAAGILAGHFMLPLTSPWGAQCPSWAGFSPWGQGNIYYLLQSIPKSAPDIYSIR